MLITVIMVTVIVEDNNNNNNNNSSEEVVNNTDTGVASNSDTRAHRGVQDVHSYRNLWKYQSNW